MPRLLFDTNVLLDAVVPTRPQSDEACEVLSRCNGAGDYGMASSLSLKDVYYILGKAMSEERARKAVGLLMGLVAIAPVGTEELDVALHSNEPDFEDGVIRSCAELNDADFIITRDKDAYAKCKVRSVTASEYLQIVA